MMNNAWLSMVYTLFGSWQLSGIYRIGTDSCRKKLPDLPDLDWKAIENKGFKVKMNFRILPD